MAARRPARGSAGAFFLAALLLAAGRLHAGPEAVAHDLREGSYLVDDCLSCERPAIQVPLRGTFRLAFAEAGGTFDRYRISDLQAADPDARYSLAGSGTYTVHAGATASLSLELQVNGAGGVRLESGEDPVTAPWPVIESEAGEDGSRDPLHVYTLRLEAAPSVPLRPYRLEEGSVLVDDCTICGRPTLLIPIEGTFLLGEIAGAPNPWITYRVDDIHFQSKNQDFDYRVSGAGIYRQGGEVALLQEVSLDVTVNDRALVLAGAPQTVPVAFPAIDVEAEEKDPPGIIVYSIRIVAGPVEKPGEPLYRRGEANADGATDISDAVSILVWLFAGGREPPCLDAADTNDDERHDITDAVYLLGYLFQSGAPPPAPGPEECGMPATPSLGCAAYPTCGGP